LLLLEKIGSQKAAHFCFLLVKILAYFARKPGGEIAAGFHAFVFVAITCNFANGVLRARWLARASDTFAKLLG
jgi:hypothetical protein